MCRREKILPFFFKQAYDVLHVDRKEAFGMSAAMVFTERQKGLYAYRLNQKIDRFVAGVQIQIEPRARERNH